MGHALLDQAAFLDAIPSACVGAVRAHWLQQWSTAVPGSDPARASVLLAPIAAALQAVIYRNFLDNIQASEQVYHRADPAKWDAQSRGLLYPLSGHLIRNISGSEAARFAGQISRDPKIIHPVARIQLRGQPARFLTAAGPSLEWSRRILKFRKNLRIRSTDAVSMSAIAF